MILMKTLKEKKEKNLLDKEQELSKLKEDVKNLSLSELNKLSVKKTFKIMEDFPNSWKYVCKKSERLKIINKEIKLIKDGKRK